MTICSLFGASNDKSVEYDFLYRKETSVGLSVHSTDTKVVIVIESRMT